VEEPDLEIQNNSNTENGGIIFDINSGISEPEQREILAGIENITAANQLALAEEKPEFRVKRGGGAFPLIVNIAALLLLAGGVFLLYVFHNKDEAQIMQGRTVYNSAERVLIQEIRRETARELEEKEREISLIISKLTGVDAELQELYSNNQELNAEQHTVELNLQRLREEYRSNLGSLQTERSRILEASRAREASLRAQLEARIGGLTAAAEQSSADLAAARAEFERLAGDQERAEAIEAQLGAHFTQAAAQIRAGNFDSAAHTFTLMREFLNTPAFQSIRSIQMRKEWYLASIDAIEALASLQTGGAPVTDTGELDELAQTVADLQTQNADLNRTLTAYTSQGSALNRRITEFETTISGLRTEISTQQRTLTERESTITELRTQNADQAARLETLNAQLTNIRQTLQSLSE
jgi:chromosome segregation ATPase